MTTWDCSCSSSFCRGEWRGRRVRVKVSFDPQSEGGRADRIVEPGRVGLVERHPDCGGGDETVM
jgi:hypothetical protein